MVELTIASLYVSLTSICSNKFYLLFWLAMNLDSNINCENKDLFLKMHKTLLLLLTKLFACHIPNRNPDKGVVIGSFEHHAKKNVGGGKKYLTY